MERRWLQQWTINLSIIVLMMVSLSGCSVVYLIDKTTDVALIPAGKGTLETRTTSTLARRGGPEIRVTLDLTALKASLADEAYYRTEQRKIKYRSNEHLLNALFLGESAVFLVGFITWIANWEEIGQTKNPDGSTTTHYDWGANAPKWSKWFMAAPAIDAALAAIEIIVVYESAGESREASRVQKKTYITPWKPGKEVRLGAPMPRRIANHPVSVSLPQFNWGIDVGTDDDGVARIPLSELATKAVENISDLQSVPNLDQVQYEVSTEVDGKTLTDSMFSDAGIFHEVVQEQRYLRQQLPADLATEVAFSDDDDFIPNNALDAGERNGKLQITVRNTGKGKGIDVQLHLQSDTASVKIAQTRSSEGMGAIVGDALASANINIAQTRSLGDIEPNAERTVTLPITTSLQAESGVANILVETKEKRGYDAQKQQVRIPVVRLQPPRLAIADVEVNDKRLGNAVGNGNGIPENDETIELIAFVTNSGEGAALGTKLELVRINSGLDVQVSEAELGTIRPGETVRAVLRFRIPRTFAAAALDYQLLVTESRGADSAEKMDAIPMSTQLPILAYSRPEPDKLITNGSTVQFSITPRNSGKLGARNVRLQLSAGGAVVTPSSTIELGAIEAGSSLKPQPFTVTLPRTFRDAQLQLKVHLSQAQFDGLDRTESYDVTLLAPDLTIADRVADASGDGKIQLGEQVELELTITNRGKLSAESARLLVSTTDPRIRIQNPERSLGSLAPNFTSNPERFAFTIPRAVPPGELPITVKVTHADFPPVIQSFNYTVYAETIASTTVTATQTPQNRQTPVVTANKPPAIVLRENLSERETVYSPSFTLRVSVSDDRGVAAVYTTHDNRRIYDSQTDPDAPRQLQASNRQSLSFETRVNLSEGENLITIMARDNNNQQESKSIRLIYEPKTTAPGLEAPADVDVDIPQSGAKNPDAVALVIGIEKYQSLPDALYADRDAIAFQQYLIRLLGVSEENIILRTNQLATGTGIKTAFRRLENLVIPGKSDVYVFYSGHGAPTINGQRYLLPTDGDPDFLSDSGYSLTAFYDRLSKLNAKSVTVFVDACFSGTDKANNPLRPGTRPIIELVEGDAAYQNLEILSSSTGTQISSSLEGKKHGLFTYYLLKGLRGEANQESDGDLTLGELEAYVHRHVADEARRLMNREQQPVFTGQKERVLYYDPKLGQR